MKNNNGSIIMVAIAISKKETVPHYVYVATANKYNPNISYFVTRNTSPQPRRHYDLNI